MIELDGDGHFSPNVDEYEERRTKFLEKQGLTVIRFENEELKENLDWVLERIKSYLERGQKNKEHARGRCDT